MNVEKLMQAAWTARDRAYAPYSQFKVGAALETENGHIFSGCNVEAANYGCTLCAERTAIVKAVSEGYLEPGGLARVLVAVKTDEPTAPCGSCRQVIEEFGTPETEIILSNEPGRIELVLRHGDLLPYSFNRSYLQKKTAPT